MTKRLERAIAQIRQLPDAAQDEAAEILLSLASRIEPLDDATKTAIEEGRTQASRDESADDGDIEHLFVPRHG